MSPDRAVSRQRSASGGCCIEGFADCGLRLIAESWRGRLNRQAPELQWQAAGGWELTALFRASLRSLAAILIIPVLLVMQGFTPAECRAEAGGGHRPHVYGVGHLDISIDGSDVEAELAVPAATLIGFEHAPRSDTESQTLRLARENLRAGDAMIRFSTRADCRLVKARVRADLPETAAAGESVEEAHGDIIAYYRFDCSQPEELDSAALGLFVGFPALKRVLVHYAMPEGKGAAELTRANPTLSFIPF